MNNIKDEKVSLEINKPIQYSISLTAKLFKRLSNHFDSLKLIGHQDRKRQSWLLKAVQEKLSREKDSEDLYKGKYISFKLQNHLYENLKNRLEEIEGKNIRYSKKKWIIDAIEEKLEAEQELIQEKLQQIKKLI